MDMYSGLYLSIEGSSPANNEWDGTTGQKFRIMETSDETVTFWTVSGAANNMVLTLPIHADSTASPVQRTHYS